MKIALAVAALMLVGCAAPTAPTTPTAPTAPSLDDALQRVENVMRVQSKMITEMGDTIHDMDVCAAADAARAPHLKRLREINEELQRQ